MTLVRLSSGSGTTPIYLVHPVGGSVLCYLLLARELAADHACFGVESPLPPAGGPDLERLARDYLREIEPGGVVLGGWSLGGLIAFDMARQRPDVAALVLIDAPAPGTAPEHEDVVLAFAHDLAAMTGQPADAARVVAATPTQRERVLWQVMRGQDPDLTEEQARRRIETFRWHSQAFGAYRPADGVACPVVIVSAENSEAEWKPWLHGPVYREQVAGDHYDVLRDPAIRRVRELIEEAIRA
jgi:thioesterase domain-containing protein